MTAPINDPKVVQNTDITQNTTDDATLNSVTTDNANIGSAQANPQVTDDSVVTENDNLIKDDEKDEKKESPLQALARKLSMLRDELVQEVPKDDEVKVESKLPEELSGVSENKENLEKTDIPTPQELNLPPLPEANNVEENSASLGLNTPLPSIDSEVKEDSQDLVSTENNESNPEIDGDLNMSQQSPELPKPEESQTLEDIVPPSPLDELNSASTDEVQQESTSDDLISTPIETEVKDDQSKDSSSVVENTNLTPQSPSEPYDPLSQFIQTPPVENTSPVQSDIMQTPLTQPVTTNSEEVSLDENDNTQVDATTVEAASIGSKYPMSINDIMQIAIERNASDIQVSVGYPVMIRIDGTLIEVNPQVVTPLNAEELIMPVLSEQKKELLEVNREVDLAYSPLNNAQARFRINAYYSKGNLTAAFRLIPSRIRTIEELMLPPLYNQLVKLSQGLVLVTGPTGHGKSTTLAAMLQAINLSRAVHMITIEDPIEFVFQPEKAVIDQREMHDDTHSWTVALKSALRQDPDVILVGEMRDYETIASTITLAETGHLVFATLHTNSAAQTVDRIIDVFPENQQAQIRTQLANIIEAVVAQRLIPIDGGGRRAVSEIMLGTPAVRNLIREGKTHQLDNVIRTSADVGMFSLEQSLVKLVRDGLITMEKAQEYAVHPEEVVRLLKT